MKNDKNRDIKISSVTVNWNGKDVLLKCIQSLKQLDFNLFEIIVVDNNSEDDSVEIIRKNFSDVVVIENNQNFGAPKGRNVGLKRALEKPIDYVLTLDNDLFIKRNCLRELLRVANDDPSIGTIGAFIYDAVNQRKLLSAGGIVDYSQNICRQLIKVPNNKSVIDVNYCGTGAMLTRRKVFDEIGLLDEGFIGYGFEDTDFGMRVKKAGYRVCTCPTAVVWHAPHSNIGRYTFRKKYLESRNAIRFMKKYARRQDWAKFLFYVIIGLPHATIFQGIIQKNMKGVWGKAKGIYDGFFNRDQIALDILEQNKENNKHRE